MSPKKEPNSQPHQRRIRLPSYSHHRHKKEVVSKPMWKCWSEAISKSMAEVAPQNFSRSLEISCEIRPPPTHMPRIRASNFQKLWELYIALYIFAARPQQLFSNDKVLRHVCMNVSYGKKYETNEILILLHNSHETAEEGQTKEERPLELLWARA